MFTRYDILLYFILFYSFLGENLGERFLICIFEQEYQQLYGNSEV